MQEAKLSVLNALKIIKEEFKPESIPSILKSEYQIVYRFDAESFLNYYKGIFTNVALEILLELINVNFSIILQV